jgi:hypothetical protein
MASSPFPTRASADADAAEPHLPASALVPVTPRQDGWTPQKQRAFIETLADTGSVTAAAGAVGMSPSGAYRLRRRTDARAFDAAWEAALGRFMDQLIPAAMDRALNGTVRDKYYHGEVVGTETVFHEKLMIWLLEKGAAMLRHAEARQAINEDWDGTMEAIEAGETTAPEPAQTYKIWLQSRLVRGEPIEAAEDAGDEDDGDEDEYGLGGNGSGGGHDDDSNDWLEDYCLTNCPPPPDFKLLAIGNPGDADYMRYLTAEEEAAWRWQGRQSQRVTHYQEAARRRLFTLDDYALDKARAHARRSARRAETAAKKAAAAAADTAAPPSETTLSPPPPTPPRIDAHTP